MSFSRQGSTLQLMAVDQPKAARSVVLLIGAAYSRQANAANIPIFDEIAETDALPASHLHQPPNSPIASIESSHHTWPQP
jgi:hypothetical protein